MEQTKRSRGQLFDVTLLTIALALLTPKQHPDTKERFVWSDIKLGQEKMVRMPLDGKQISETMNTYRPNQMLPPPAPTTTVQQPLS